MALLSASFPGTAIPKNCPISVILPDPGASARRFPVLYLLHGRGDDHTSWVRSSAVERLVAELPLIVAMPDGGLTWYTDAPGGPAGESHVLRDVVGFVDRFFPTIPAREGRAVGGLSMGGYGAMKLALKHPEVFGSVAAHSSVFRPFRHAEASAVGFEAPELAGIFGSKSEGGPEDVFALAGRLDRSRAPRIRFDCGIEDPFLEESRAFDRHLARLGVPHEYQEFPGGHTWAYWDLRLPEALRFHWAFLRESL